MKIPAYQVHAFTNQLFTGNPAAVCPLEQWLEDDVLQSIAREFNLSETAFFVPDGERYQLRWMTPAMEIDLCGHATLASAFVIMNHIATKRNEVFFDTRSGELIVKRQGSLLSMDFPSRPSSLCETEPQLTKALDLHPSEVWASERDYLVVYGSEEELRLLTPDMHVLAGLDRQAVIVTAPGTDADFVSRFFAPAMGIAEDPVTGSAHCTLTPYWSKRLGKTQLHARQVSARGGELWCEDRGARVNISGQAVLYLEGSLHL